MRGLKRLPCGSPCRTGTRRSCLPNAASRSITSPSTGGCNSPANYTFYMAKLNGLRLGLYTSTHAPIMTGQASRQSDLACATEPAGAGVR
ncbi:exported hypothetical protein [Parafrankia sp. Ea1.12]|nr:exported hypothetical protein [Parafrankia sp. Ea1.12]